MSWLRDVSDEIGGMLRTHRVALLVFPLLAAIFLGQVLFTDRSLSAFDIIAAQPSWTAEFGHPGIHQPILSDSPTAHYPERKLEWDLFKAGQNVNYDPYIFSGVPTFGQKVGAFVTSLPQLLLSVPNAIDWSTWTRLALAGIFMYLLLANIGLGKTASIFGGIVWTYNLHQVVWLEFPQHLATQLWIPLLLLLNIKAITSGFRRDFVIGLFVTNILFYTSGYTQIVLYTYIAIGAFNTFYIFSDRDTTLRVRLLNWLKIHGIFIAAALVLALGIYMEAGEIKNGLRDAQHWRSHVSHLKLDLSTVFGFFRDLIPNAGEIKRFMSPDYYGGIWGHHGYHSPDHGNIVEGAAYIGISSLFFVFYAVLTGMDKPRRRMFYSVIALLLFFIAFYYQNPVVMRLVNLSPFAGLGTYSRSITIIIFLLSVTSAYGLERFLRHIEDRSYIRILAVLAIFGLTPVAVRVIEANVGLSQFVYLYAVTAALGAVGLLLAWRRQVALLGVVMVVAITADLFAVGYNFNTKLPNEQIFRPTSTLRFLLQDHSTYRVAVMADNPIYHPNILEYFKIASVDGYSTVVPRNYVAYIRKVVGDSTITPNGILFLFRADVRALRMMNVKYIISDKPLPGTDIELKLRNNASYLYEIKNSLNRVYCASDYFLGKDIDASMGRVKNLIRDYDKPALVVNGNLKDAEKLTAGCEVKGLRVYTNGLHFETTTDKPSYAVLPYNYSPNWKIRINGNDARLYKTNFEFMGFDVPAGTNRIEIYYSNDMRIITAVVLILVGLALIVYGIVARRGKAVGLVFGVVGALMVWKNVYSLPGVRNDHIPERPAVSKLASAPVDTLGLDRVKNAAPSKIVTANNKITDNFVSPLNGLRGVGVFVATYQQKDLPYDVTVRVREIGNNKTYKKVFPGKDIRDNMWLNLSFPEILDSKKKHFEIEVSVTAEDRQHPMAVWLDSARKPCIVTYHDPENAYR